MRIRPYIHCIICGMLYQEDNGWPLHTCPNCRINDRERQAIIVKQARLRPTDKIAPRDLTLEQWLETLRYFKALCAYCQAKPYECLEHFVPLKLGGGTTISNVVPSCLSCNKLKDHLHPALVTKIPRTDVERVRDYLQSF